MNMRPNSVEPAAERVRRYRKRQARGERVARIPVDDVAVAAALVAAGLLAPADADDPRKADEALARAVRVWVCNT